jgi:CubicO group peptidase (beta-lactamase class C family)
MMLYEHGLFHLDDPVDGFIPELKDLQVLRAGARSIDDVEPLARPLTVHHLLTHTAGFTYGFNGGVLGEAYEKNKVGFGPRSGGLVPMIERLATMPLAFQPGDRWNYGVSTDVVGRLIEVISGEPLDAYLTSRVLEPLGMRQTGFGVPEDRLGRFASLYGPDDSSGMTLLESAEKSAFRAEQVTTISAGGGLCSTIHDYARFAEFLRRGGELDGERLIGPRTLEFMASNHLPGDLASMGQPVFAETSFAGIGFGLGFSVMLEPEIAQTPGSPGDFGWGGRASTTFIVDPVEDLVAIFFTQLAPSSTYPLRKELRALVYQALID